MSGTPIRCQRSDCSRIATRHVAGHWCEQHRPGLDERYERCVDPDCPDAYAFRAPFPDGEHWHPRP